MTSAPIRLPARPTSRALPLVDMAIAGGCPSGSHLGQHVGREEALDEQHEAAPVAIQDRRCAGDDAADGNWC